MFTITYAERVLFRTDLAAHCGRFGSSGWRFYSIRSTSNSPMSQPARLETGRCCAVLAPPWEHVPPVWELRVDEYRVFYDVAELAGGGCDPRRAPQAAAQNNGGNPMKTIDIQTNLDACVSPPRDRQGVVVTRGGNPVALVVGVEGLDEEQTQLGASDEFWKLISARRTEPTIGRAALEEKLKG